MSDLQQTFLDEIESFLKRSRMPASTMGWEAIKDRNFVSDLRSGRRSPSLRLADRVLHFIRSQEEESAA